MLARDAYGLMDMEQKWRWDEQRWQWKAQRQEEKYAEQTDAQGSRDGTCQTIKAESCEGHQGNKTPKEENEDRKGERSIEDQQKSTHPPKRCTMHQEVLWYKKQENQNLNNKNKK